MVLATRDVFLGVYSEEKPVELALAVFGAILKFCVLIGGVILRHGGCTAGLFVF